MLAGVGLAAVVGAGCSGPPFFAPIEGEPTCADFEIGPARTKMAGGLRNPVEVRFKAGKDIVHKTLIRGSTSDHKPQSYLPDDTREYTVEWVQCSNERAPRAVSPASKAPKSKDKARDFEKDTIGYECGDGTVYKTDKLATRKGDPASHKITFVAPPKPACWESDAAPPAVSAAPTAPPAPPPAATASDSAAPAAPPAPSGSADAGPPAVDGGK